MKQILQNLGNGETILADVPCPRRGSGSVLIETKCSLISLGTEKMLINFGKGSFLAKARSQPDAVKQVLQKIKTDGLKATVDTVRAKLNSPLPLGYCNVGRVVESGADSEFTTGDRVISNGPHAEMVAINENIVAKIPDAVDDQTAAHAVVCAIGLQGIRLLKPTLGERIVVSGLGLIGLLAIQMLRAHGCQVLGIDFDARKLELARQFGAETVDLSKGQDPVAVASAWTGGDGVDGILITAATKTSDLIHQSATMCRKRGRIVLVGVVGLNLQRADFYKKELSFQVSCSYGPGRYEDNYEKNGLDYPLGFVRWTQKRNFQAVLQLMADGAIDVTPLITHRFSFDDAIKGYQAVDEPGTMGILLEYSGDEKTSAEKQRRQITLNSQSSQAQPTGGVPNIAFIGAGGFATRMLLPLMPKQSAVRKSIVSGTGVSAAYAGKKFNFQEISSDSAAVFNDSSIDAVFITTPHNLHGSMAVSALNAGKHVFVEKPLAMTFEELDEVQQAHHSNPDQCLMVGFNRRFSPHVIELKKWLQSCAGTKAIILTVNAGAIPADHWTQNRKVGGGRIIGEGCHFIDLARHLADSPIVAVNAVPMVGGDGALGDCAVIHLTFADGSIATIHYLANGNKNFPKERIEIFAGQKVMQCDNYRKSVEIGGTRKLKTRSQDKGHANELKEFLKTITDGGAWPIPAEQLFEVSRITLEADQQIQQQLKERS